MPIGNVTGLSSNKVLSSLARKIRLVVADDVKTQVINTETNKIVREIPYNPSSQVLINIVA